MKDKFEITDAAVAEMRRVFHKTHVGGPDSPYRAALAAALPFCKRTDDNTRLHLFDGRFTLPLVVKSYPGVSFIHPASNDSAPVCVITCDDHPTIAAGIVDAIAAAHTACMDEGDAAFRAVNANAVEKIRAACGPSLDASWVEKARELFGDQKRSTLLVIGAALAKIAEVLPCRLHIEVGYPDEVASATADTAEANDGPDVVNNTVTVNISVNGSVDAEATQKIANEVKKAMEAAVNPAFIVKPTQMPSTEELQKLAASVGAVFLPYDKVDREKYIACLNARATAFETAIEVVKASAPQATGAWDAYRAWALRSIPDLERCMKSARREAAIASAGEKE